MVGGVQQESCIKEFVYRIATVPLSRRVHIHTHPNMSHLSVPPSFPPSHHPLTTLSPSHALDLSLSHHHYLTHPLLYKVFVRGKPGGEEHHPYLPHLPHLPHLPWWRQWCLDHIH